ncbi:MAG: nucleoside hydrolase [Spirochaetia bacterium]|nr:nucleoside hydrolase [Spirochaetia bacterium]
MKELLYDTDLIGDDLLTLMVIAGTKDVSLAGVTAYGRRIGALGRCRIAQQLLDYLGTTGVDIVPGADRPMLQDPLQGCIFCDNVISSYVSSKWDAQRIYQNQILDKKAAEYLVEKANKSPGKYTLLCTGPLTNLALALELDSTIATKFQEVYVMGGTYAVRGNSSPVAEANFYNDPEAAKLVFSHFSGIKIVGLDVTLRFAINRNTLSFSNESYLKNFFCDLVYSCCCAHKEKGTGLLMPLHDTLAFLELADPGILTFKKMKATIGTGAGRTRGMMVCCPDDGNVRLNSQYIAVDVDLDRARRYFAACMERIIK